MFQKNLESISFYTILYWCYHLQLASSSSSADSANGGQFLDSRTHYKMEKEFSNSTVTGIVSESVISGTEKIVELDFDSPVFPSEDFKLECRYDRLARSGYERLYSIKWYKDDEEFFQYMPHEFPRVQHYNNKIITERPEYEIEPGTFRLVLKNVNLNFQGTYGCELSTEAPEFMTFKDYKSLEVYVLPTKSPRISGNKLNFLLKSRIDLNCTSPKSKPVSKLQWFINDKLAPNDYQINYQPVNHSDGLQSRTVRLRFIVNEDHYQFGHMRLECVAVYNRLGSNGSSKFFIDRRHHQSRKKNNKTTSHRGTTRNNRALTTTGIGRPVWLMVLTVATMMVMKSYTIEIYSV